ncbi:hypothetical protein T05_15574 [Trichinella murrelli]|uniref:Uncharacterized protein n=1 Tax=Trichinella murrelli TaxID=144512 RepID=A0A0V0SXF7_9BILA|nr:hypothetical protein T05_15574 [Trichinella murrelli]
MQCPPHCELKKVQQLPGYFHLLPTFCWHHETQKTRIINGLPPLGLNYIRIRAHCSFIGRCLRYFIRP